MNSFKLITSVHDNFHHFSHLVKEFSAIGGQVMPYKDKVKNAADIVLIEAIEEFLAENINLNPHILIISGDSIFKNFSLQLKKKFNIQTMDNRMFGNLQKLKFQ